MALPVFKTGDRHLRCRWCVRLAHASASFNHLAWRACRFRNDMALVSALPAPAVIMVGNVGCLDQKSLAAHDDECVSFAEELR